MGDVMKKFLIGCCLLMLSGCSISPDFIDCKGNNEVGGFCVDTTPPVFRGVDDIEIDLGTSFSPMVNVFAEDDMSGDLTDQITHTGQVNTKQYGTYFITYSVTDEAGNETIALRYVTVRYDDTKNSNPNLVTNGDFHNGFQGYSTYMAEQGSGTFTVVNQVLVITVTKVTSKINWEPRLEYQSLLFEEGHRYYVSFDIKSEETRYVEVLIGELISNDPWFLDYSLEHDAQFVVGETWMNVSFMFTMYEPTTTNGCILFQFGGIAAANHLTTLYLDNISIKEVE